MRTLHAFLVTAVCLSVSAISAATEVRTVSPSQIPAGKRVRVLLRGTGLNDTQSCSIQAMTEDASTVEADAKKTTDGVPPCVVKGKRDGGHTWHGSEKLDDLVLEIASKATPVEGPYLILLSKVAEPTQRAGAGTLDPFQQASAVVKIRVFQAKEKPSSKSPEKSQDAPPYTDCVSMAPASGGLASVPVAGGGVACGASPLTRGEVIDNFGRHVSDRYNAIQVRVANRNAKYDFLLRDIVLTLPDGRVISGRIRRFAEGVAVKGKTLDRRALAYNSLTAVGQVYGALTVFASEGFQTAGNIFQGTGISAFSQVFPDTTAENITRFTSSVFNDQNPAIVPKDSVGQPPLYVVALVPKEPGLESYDYAKDIQVAVEGTYIKQVSVVELDADTKDFGSEFVSPEVLNASRSFAVMRDKAKAMRILVSNSNATPLNLRGIKITNSGVPANAPHFVLDESKTTCAVKGQAAALNQPFSVAANDQCAIFVRFQPQAAGPVQATLSLDGDNLEGNHQVTLHGNGIGLVLKAGDAALPCSLNDKDCTWNVPSVAGASPTLQAALSGAKGLTPIKIKPAGGTEVSVPLTDDWSTPTTVPLNFDASVSSVPVILTGDGFPTDGYKITVNLQTKDTTLQLDTAGAGSSDVTVTATLNVDQATGGTVIFKVNGAAKPAVPVANKTASIHLTTPGVDQEVQAEYTGTAVYRKASSTTLKVTVLSAATISPKPPVLLGRKTVVGVTVNAKDGGGACGGTVALQFTTRPDGATDADIKAEPLTGGVSSLTFTASKAGDYAGKILYESDGKTCAKAEQTVTIKVP